MYLLNKRTAGIVILLLMPNEEEELRRAYGERYVVYQDTVKRLAAPFL